MGRRVEPRPRPRRGGRPTEARRDSSSEAKDRITLDWRCRPRWTTNPYGFPSPTFSICTACRTGTSTP
ncbi:MAG: hypothetical protein EHM65_06805 [Acidobacteriales bacterium]|nr:MAG: hypothetical protein EHM65_06805 [Terriglobales bacterium]